MKKQLLLFCFLLVTSLTYAQTVYVTKTGKKYHEATCRYVSATASSLTVKEANSRDYTPCSVCKPATITSETTTANSLYIPSKQTSASATGSRATSVQCSGRTKKGTRCKRNTTNANGYCYQHGG